MGDMVNMRPKSLNILGAVYTVTYTSNPLEIDIYKRESLWGQVDYWTRSIRIYDNGHMGDADILHLLLHEVLHAIATGLKLKLNDNDMHDELDLLALSLADVLTRNGMVQVGSPLRED